MKNFYSYLTLAAALLFSSAAYSQPKLSSYPSAKATVYLDFDGEQVNSYVWNNGNTIDCSPAAMNDNQITEVFNRVSEDYRPFNINITTDLETFLAAPVPQRIRVIVTPTSAWFTGVGGVAYVGSFNWGDDTPCFVFCDRLNNSAKMVGECCSHESGHCLGLSHQSKYDAACNLTATYNAGIGSGEVGWAPIMGNSYYKNMSGWNNGPTPYGCANIQDNLTILTTKNGFTYRDDDYTDDINSTVTAVNPLSININGLISTNTDKDAFTFQLKQSSSFRIDAHPYSVAANNTGADLDLKLSLYNTNKQLIRVYNPANSMSVSIDTFLTEGTYYMVVDGTGNSNATDYGSLGSYSITGLSGTLPIHSVSLSGSTEKNIHRLSWDIISGDAIKSIAVESSADGIHFIKLNTVDAAFKNFSYTTLEHHAIYYRLKVTSVFNQAVYSNTVALKAIDAGGKNFIVSTFAHNELTVNAGEKFQYMLLTANGKLIMKGSGNNGFNRLDINRQPNGLYILQLVGSNKIQAERIIKQ